MSVPLTCIAYFGSEAGRGWAEKHVKNVDDAPGDLLPFLQSFKLLIDTYRVPLLGRDRYVKGLRVSYPTATGAIASSPFRYSPFSFPGNQREGCAPSVAAEVRFGESTNTQFSNTYIRGFWDAVEKDEQLDFSTAAGDAWKTLLDQYTSALIVREYGWEGLNEALTQRGDVTGYVVGGDGRVTLTLDVTSGPAITSAPGTKLNFRAARINESNSPLNSSFVVQVVDGTHVKSVRRIAAGPFVTAGTFVIEHLQFLKYTGVQYVILAKRAEGRPTLASRTRAKARARY